MVELILTLNHFTKNMLLYLAITLGVGRARPDRVRRKSIVWLLVDDLRPQTLQGYGQRETLTPKLDALLSESVVFERAYCQLPVCSPSRNSFLTGRRPDSLRVYNFETHFRETRRDVTSIFEYFKSHGYTTIGSGKTFQPNKPPYYDGFRSWSSHHDKPWYLPLVKNYTWCRLRRGKKRLDVCPEGDLPQSEFMDRKIADFMVEAIGTVRQQRRDFFAVAGFYRPHLRWVMPREFYDLYSDSQPSPPSRSRHKPKGMPDIAWTNEGCHTMTTAQETGVIDMNVPLGEHLSSELRKGYFACVSWIDYLCGLVLEATPEDAIVIFSSDHGFHLGEQASWTKHTLFELSARVPLAIRDPGLSRPAVLAEPIVELVDIFRTTVDLAGLPSPPMDTVHGRSVAPLMRAMGSPFNFSFAVSQYPRCPSSFSRLWDTNCKRVPNNKVPIMGYSIRVQGFRFTEWYRVTFTRDSEALRIDTDTPPVATELYAYDESQLHNFDEALELVNIAVDHPCAVEHFRAALLLFIAKCQYFSPQLASAAECEERTNIILGKAKRFAQASHTDSSSASADVPHCPQPAVFSTDTMRSLRRR